MTLNGATSVDDVAQALVNALSVAEDARWLAGDVLLSLGDACPPLRVLGGMVGTSAAYLSVLRSVARTFPDGTRAADQKWQMHRLAASCPDPEATLHAAIGAGWSTKQLEDDLVLRGVLKGRSRLLNPGVDTVMDGIVAAFESLDAEARRVCMSRLVSLNPS